MSFLIFIVRILIKISCILFDLVEGDSVLVSGFNILVDVLFWIFISEYWNTRLTLDLCQGQHHADLNEKIVGIGNTQHILRNFVDDVEHDAVVCRAWVIMSRQRMPISIRGLFDFVNDLNWTKLQNRWHRLVNRLPSAAEEDAIRVPCSGAMCRTPTVEQVER